MFLAKVWKISNGKKYEAWVLKRGVWDKQEKRYRQLYLAYIGTSTAISPKKADQICEKLAISLDELLKVRRLKITDIDLSSTVDQPHVESISPLASSQFGLTQSAPVSETTHVSGQMTSQSFSALGVDSALLIRKLREQFGLSRTPKCYEELAMRVGVLRVSAPELRRVEAHEASLRPEQIEWLKNLLAPKR